jgi:hypothetical protein
MKIKTKLTVVFVAAALIGLLFAACSGGGADTGGGATAPVITTTTLQPGVVGTAYTAPALAATGAKPITWSIETGTLPAGLTLAAATGVISGMPTTAVNATAFTVKATNSAGSDTKQLSITITGTPVAGAPHITTDSLPGGVLNTAYTATLEATGTGITWSIETGTLPAGLTLAAATGIISGTPSAVATSTFTVKATNSAGNDTKQLSIAITATAVAPAITTTSLPNGQINTAYSEHLIATGTGPITWSIETGGSLPAGLTLAAATGIISGTPTTAGNSTFTVKAANSTGNDTKPLSITITGPSDPIPVAADFTITKLTQTEGKVSVVGVSPNTGKSDGAISIKYNGAATLPQTKGTYAVTFDVAATAGWSAASNLPAGNLVVAIGPAQDSIYDMGLYLNELATNTISTPYTIKLNVNDLPPVTTSDDASWGTSLVQAINGDVGVWPNTEYQGKKYLILDLSGSTVTQIKNNFLYIFANGTTEPLHLGPNIPYLTGIVLPNTVTTIGSNAFRSCINLKDVTLSNTLTTIDVAAFDGCAIESITIPASVTRIAHYAFRGKSKDDNRLKSITFAGTITSTHINTGYTETQWSTTDSGITSNMFSMFAFSWTVDGTDPANPANIPRGDQPQAGPRTAFYQGAETTGGTPGTYVKGTDGTWTKN